MSQPSFNAPPSFRFARPKPPPSARSPTRSNAAARPQTPLAQHDRPRQSVTYREEHQEDSRGHVYGAITPGFSGCPVVEPVSSRQQDHTNNEPTPQRHDEEMPDWNRNTTIDTPSIQSRRFTPTFAQPKRRRLDTSPGSGLNDNNGGVFPRPSSKQFQTSALTGGARRDVEADRGGAKRAAATPTFNTPRTFRAVLPPRDATPARPSPAGTGMPSNTTTTADTPLPQRPRFLSPTSSTTFPSIDTTTSPSHHTPFLLHPSNPNTNPAPPATALPDIFSPHKRKQQRYLPGGFADQVRGWLLDVGAGGGAVPAVLGTSQRRESRGGHEEVTLEMVDACTAAAGGGVGSVAVGFARPADVEGDTSVRVLLVGPGGSGAGGNGLGSRIKGGRDGALRPGKPVAVRMPVWEVDVQGVEKASHEEDEEQEKEEQEGKDRQTWVICPAWRPA